MLLCIFVIQFVLCLLRELKFFLYDPTKSLSIQSAVLWNYEPLFQNIESNNYLGFPTSAHIKSQILSSPFIQNIRPLFQHAHIEKHPFHIKAGTVYLSQQFDLHNFNYSNNIKRSKQSCL